MQKQYLKPSVLILHGWGGSDAPHWQNSLAKNLVSDGFPVYFPQLPKRDNPTLKEWVTALDEIMDSFTPSIVICHSLANILLFHYLEATPEASFEKILLVAPPSSDNGNPEITSFFPFPTPNINAKQKLLVASTNDKYASSVDAITIAMNSGCEIHIVENGGHINTESGFGEWDFAYDWIRAN
jgi:hypothetical protein